MFRIVTKMKTPAFSRNFYTSQIKISDLVYKKKEKLQTKIDEGIYITKDENILDCKHFTQNTDINIIPIVNNSNEKKLISVLNVKEINSNIMIQEYFNEEDYINRQDTCGNH
jgi:hypothetical protein